MAWNTSSSASGCRLKAMPRSRSMSELGRPATSIQVWPGVPRWKRHSSTSTPCSTCTSSGVYSTSVKSSASSGTGARPASVPGAVPGLVWRWMTPSMSPKAPLPASDLLPLLRPLLHKVLVFPVTYQRAGLVMDGELHGDHTRVAPRFQIADLEHRIERVTAVDRLQEA